MKYGHIINTVEETVDQLGPLYDRAMAGEFDPAICNLIEILYNYFNSEAGKNERANMDVADLINYGKEKDTGV